MRLKLTYKNMAAAAIASFLFAGIIAQAQIMPTEGKEINYRLIGFSFPQKQNANNYSLEISIGNFSNEDSFKRHIIISKDCKFNKIIAEVPSFGQVYTWRPVYIIGHSKLEYGFLHHFNVMYSPDVDTNIIRLRVMKNCEKYKSAYVFIDDHKALYDMKGHPVWFLPKIDSTLNDSYLPRDIKITPQGTITLIIRDKIYELNYNGEILWTPSETATVNGESEEHFHHEFTRLTNGHYMALGSETINVFFPDSSRQDKPGTRVVTQKDSAWQQQQTGWYFFAKKPSQPL